MPELRLVQVDAFTDRPFTGNPAAVMPLDAWLPDETLQAIAAENNLSETACTRLAAGGSAPGDPAGKQSQRNPLHDSGRGRRGGLRSALVHADHRGRTLRPC